MIASLGRYGNFRVWCDREGCLNNYDGRKAEWEITVEYTPSKVRRQARRRGWACERAPNGDVLSDLCPRHNPLTCADVDVSYESVDQPQITSGQ